MKAQEKNYCGIVTVSFFLIFSLLVPERLIWGTVSEHREILIDFTNPEKVKQIANWSTECQVDCSEAGLGWDGKENEYCDVAIRKSEPVSVGWSWHPVTEVIVNMDTAFSDKIKSSVDKLTVGSLFTRYSPDGVHWSNWQKLNMQFRTRQGTEKACFEGRLSVPRSVRQNYEKFLKEFSGTGKAYGLDEEKAVLWILEKQPDYFEKELPFIGYVDFLYETSIRGDRPLARINIGLDYFRGGKVSFPQGDENTPWRFKLKEDTAGSRIKNPSENQGGIFSDFAWGQEHDGLKIGIRRYEAPRTDPNYNADLGIALYNSSGKDMVLNLGIMLANGKKQYPGALKLIFTDDKGQDQEYNTLPARVAGRVDPLIVPMPAGSTYILSLGVDDLHSKAGQKLAKGRYMVRAMFEGSGVEKEYNSDMEGLRFMPYWSGIIRSGEIAYSR